MPRLASCGSHKGASAMLGMLTKRLDARAAESRRRGDRHFPFDAGAPRRSRRLFRRSAATTEAVEQIRVKLGLGTNR